MDIINNPNEGIDLIDDISDMDREEILKRFFNSHRRNDKWQNHWLQRFHPGKPVKFCMNCGITRLLTDFTHFQSADCRFCIRTEFSRIP